MHAPATTCSGFLLGHAPGAVRERTASRSRSRSPRWTPRYVGMLIALYERAVGFYASLVNINAYHQPGVEAGKKAGGGGAGRSSKKILATLNGQPRSVDEVAASIGAAEDIEHVYKILEHMAANPDHGVKRNGDAKHPFSATYVRSV